MDRQHTVHSGITSFDIKLKDTIETLDLTQVINQPTRETEHIANLRDLVITNSTELITDCGTLPPFSTIDHYPVCVTLDITQPNIPPKSFTHWDYARLDANKLTQLLMDTDWDSILDEDIDIATEKFTSAILGAASSSIPKKTKQIRHKDKPWMTNYLKLNIRKRDRLFKLARKRQSQKDWDKWKQQRNFATLLNRQLRDQHIHTQVGKLLHNKHDAFKYHKTLKTLIGHNKGSSIPPLSTDDSLNGTTVTDEQEKSNILNDFFASQTQLTDIPSLPDTTADTDREPVPALNSITVEKEEVLNLLNSLDTNKSTGPDQLPSKILKMSALLIYEPLTKLFNKSLNTATFPKSWKVANITPIFKNKGSASNPANYRPISILPCLSKILEKIVFRRIYQHVTAQNLLSDKQSGYRPHHSTQLQLVHLTHNIDKALDRGDDFTAIYLDITKYFDKIWHSESGLLYKCRNNFHITDKILDWLKSYLTDRQHRVRLGDTYSNIRTINVGCPQGSILGPLLAILYLDELADKTENTALLYADDISLYSSHSTQNANIIQRSLQRDLDFIERYGKKWAITFSQTKTISQTFSNNHRPSTLTLTFSGQQIQSTDSHKHLGLHLSKDLRYHKHVNDIIRKVNIALSPLYSIASKLPRQVLEQIYKTYIRPYFDYCDAVFDGHLTAYDKRRLETLQNRAARLVTGTLYRTSSGKLRLELGWERLSTRREIHRLTLFWQLLTCPAIPDYIRQTLPRPRQVDTVRTLRTSNTLTVPENRTSRFQRSFIPGTTRTWNKLPEHIRSQDTLNKFKKEITALMGAERPPDYFSYGSKIGNKIHTQLRLGNSTLNSHLFQFQKVPHPNCQCGQGLETALHFTLHCPLHAQLRDTLFQAITNELNTDFSHFTTNQKYNTLIYGKHMNTTSSRRVAYHFQKIIISTNRFT